MDPIANLCNVLSNGQRAHKTYVSVPYAKNSWILLHLLYSHGIIAGMGLRKAVLTNHPTVPTKKQRMRIVVVLQHEAHHTPFMFSLVRVSSPKKRVYMKVHELRNTASGFGFRIVSTTKGIMAEHDALQANLGGEILCAYQ